jgi:hypothetical protein
MHYTLGLWKNCIAGRHDDLSNALSRSQATTLGECVVGNRVTAKFRRAEIERRFAPKELQVAIERFELNPGKSDIVRFLNEHADE